MTNEAANPVDSMDCGIHDVDKHANSSRRSGIGVATIVFFVVSAAAPMTTAAVSIPGAIAVTGNVGAPLFFLVAGAVLLLFAVGFSAMTRHVRNAGAFYSYVQAGLGRAPGLGAAAVAVVSYYLLQVAMTVFLGVAISNFIGTLSPVRVPWPIASFVMWALIGVLGYLNVELSAKILGALLVLETLTVLVVDLVVVSRGNAQVAAASFSLDHAFGGSWSVALMYCFLGFIGFEATAVFRREARDPMRTVPRATSISIILIATFYALSASAIVATIVDKPKLLQDPSSLFLTLAATYLSPAMAPVVALFTVTSIFAATLSLQNVIARYQFTLAESGVLPKRLATVSPRFRTPSTSSLVVSVVTVSCLVLAAASGLDPLLKINAWLSGAATLGIIFLMALTSVSVVVFFRRTPYASVSLWKGSLAPSVAAALLLVLVVLVATNLPTLIGDPVASAIVAPAMFVVFILGLIAGAVIRRVSPRRYEALAEH